MREALNFVGSLFPKWGGLLVGLVAIFALGGLVLRNVGSIGPIVARTCFQLATLSLIAFVVIAIAFAFRV